MHGNKVTAEIDICKVSIAQNKFRTTFLYHYNKNRIKYLRQNDVEKYGGNVPIMSDFD